MKVVATFDPSVTEVTPYGTGGSFNIGQMGSVRFIITNDSIYGLQLFTQDGKNLYIPAWMVYAVCTTLPSSTIYWVRMNSLSSTNPPISTVVVELYSQGEHLQGTYPTSLQRHYVGNPVPLDTASTSLTNEASAVGTRVIDIGTVANNNLIDIFNDHFTIKVEQAGVAKTVLTGRTTGNPGALGAASETTEVLGNLLLSANNSSFLQGKDTGGTARNMMILDSGNNVKFLGITGKDVFLFQLSTGTNIARIDSSGIDLLSGTIALLTGSLARLSKFSAAVTTGAANSVAHGLGATPDFIALSFNLTSAPVAATIGYDASTLSSTNVDIWTSVNTNIIGLAFKF